MVDFAAIRAHRGSQNNGFEELVVQLVRRRPPIGRKAFRRIEGAGGDAGVEAMWLMNDGSAIGIQAKFFLRVRDIDWTQIDESVTATLKSRREVTVYRIALACDLTDKGGTKGQGKTGWAAWDVRVKRWEAEALALGRSVSFEPITASDLVDWLGQPSAAGLAGYWFGTDVLAPPWFAEQVRVASADLGERYTPEQHVVVAASLAFDGIARTATLRSRLLQAVEATWKHSVAARAAGLSDHVKEAAERAEQALKRVHTIADAMGSGGQRIGSAMTGRHRIMVASARAWSHLDASRPEGVRLRFPTPELIRLMGLKAPSPRSPHAARNSAGRNVIVHEGDEEGSFSVSVLRESFERLLREQELGCLWFVFGERSAWPTGGHDQSTRRWFGSLIRLDGDKTRRLDWETPW